MKRRFIVATLCLAASACGNYNNEDIAFLEALPDRGALSVDVPQQGQALTSGVAPYYQNTVEVAQNVNASTMQIVDAIDAVRQISPSKRTPTERIWGPFDDKKHPGFVDRLRLTREGDHYAYAFELKKKTASDADYVQVVAGVFYSQSAAGGHGTLDFDAAAVDRLGIPRDNPNLDTLDVAYANDVSPRRVQTSIAGADGTQLRYLYAESADHSGKLTFSLTADFNRDGAFEQADIVSRWVAGGAGRADAVVHGGSLGAVQDTVAECWNAQFAEVYYDSRQSDGSAGLGCDALGGHSSCPDGEAQQCVIR